LVAACFPAHAGDGIQFAGNILHIAVPAAAVGMTVGYRDGQGAIQFAESAALTMGATYVLKHTLDEQRPDGGSESFPSGHAAIAFCSAEFIRKRYGWEYGLPSYAVASFVAYSRVEARRHHPHDVAAGAALGMISSYVFTTPYKGWTVEPQVDADYYGIQFARSW
jgi:membrane-associated phospholipid phosphatase